MPYIKHEFRNELGNQILISVENDSQGVTVIAQGPTSQVEHTWTPEEAKVLRMLLELLEPAYM